MDELKKIDEFNLNDGIDSEAFKKAFNQIYESVDTIDLSKLKSVTVCDSININLPNLCNLLKMLTEKRLPALRNITVTLINPEGFECEVINKSIMDYEGWMHWYNILNWGNAEIKRVHFQYPGQWGVYMNQIIVDFYTSNKVVPPGFIISYSIANFSWINVKKELWSKFYHKDVKIKIQIEI